MIALALVEHVDRELDLVCLARLLLRQRHGIELKIANFYADAPLLLAGPAPDVVLTPFFYAAEDAVLSDYVKAWPAARFVNLAWEQVFYPSHQAIKAPRDDFTRTRVTHLAWSRSFIDYLRANGVLADRTRLVGHGVYRLYQEPYRGYFPGRPELARRFGLDEARRWIFVPENYRWAFFTDSKLKRLTKHGLERDELFAMRDYCRTSLTALVRWCDALAREGQVEVIFRPRPATSVEEISGFIGQVLGGAAPAFRLIKDGSAREWVIAADAVASSYSTVLIEAALAGKDILKIEAEPIPAGLHYDWCDLVPGVSTEEAFLAACLQADRADSSRPLRQWAEAMFFPAGDPVSGLVEAIAAEVKAAPGAPRRAGRPGAMPMPPWLAPLATLAPPPLRHRLFERWVKGYFFNYGTHEKDLFGRSEVARRVQRWRRVLAAGPDHPRSR